MKIDKKKESSFRKVEATGCVTIVYEENEVQEVHVNGKTWYRGKDFVEAIVYRPRGDDPYWYIEMD